MPYRIGSLPRLRQAIEVKSSGLRNYVASITWSEGQVQQLLLAAICSALVTIASLLAVPVSDTFIPHFNGLAVIAGAAVLGGFPPALVSGGVFAAILLLYTLATGAALPSPVRIAAIVVASALILLSALAVDRRRRTVAHRLAEAQRREAHFRSVFATMPDGMIVADEHGFILSFNPAAEQMFGWREADLIGQDLTLLMREDEAKRHADFVRRYVLTGQRRLIGLGRTVIGRRQDGTLFPVEITIGVASTDRRVFTAFLRDLTEIARAEARVNELHNELAHTARASAMSALASTLAHEVSQPLANVTNYVESARHLLTEPATTDLRIVDGALEEAGAEALRAGEIVRRMREMIARGDVQKTFADIGELVQEAGLLGLAGAREKGIDVQIRVASARVLVDRVQIQQVLINLMRNAQEAVAKSPRKKIRITGMADTDGMFRVSIADTGPGIAAEMTPRLFDAFASTKREGVGIGLSICRTIVEAHGGRIWHQGRQGGVTLFHFTLPLAEEPADG